MPRSRAIEAGATSVWEVGHRNGWRLGRVLDPFGHHWEIGKPVAKESERKATDEHRVRA